MVNRTRLAALTIALLLIPLEGRAGESLRTWGLPALRSIDQIEAPSGGESRGLFGGLLAEWVGPTTVTSRTFALQDPLLRLKDLRPDSEMPRTKGLLSSMPLFDGHLIAETEFARNETGGDSVIPRDHASNGMMRVALATDNGPLRYGISYRLAGKEFLTESDQESHELWAEWKMGSIRLRSSVSELFTNVEEDPTRPRVALTTGRISMTLARPSWPEFSVSYAHNLTEIDVFQSGLTPERGVADTVEGAVSLTRSRWNARLSSSYVMHSNQLHPAEDTVSYAQMLTGVLRPIEPLTITSVISYRTDVQQWTGVRTETPVASLAMNYRHSATWMISALGGYTGMRSSDGVTDYESLNSKGVVTWSPRGWSATQVSFETGYTRTVLGGTAGGGAVTEDLSGLVRFRWTQF